MSEKNTNNSAKPASKKSSSGKKSASGEWKIKAKKTAASVAKRSVGKSKIAAKESASLNMTQAEWKRFNSLEDKDIDTSDIPELDEHFWKEARLVMPKHKKAISLRIDEEMLAWFKAQGKGYQSLMNAVLRSYYDAHDGK